MVHLGLYPKWWCGAQYWGVNNKAEENMFPVNCLSSCSCIGFSSDVSHGDIKPKLGTPKAFAQLTHIGACMTRLLGFATVAILKPNIVRLYMERRWLWICDHIFGLFRSLWSPSAFRQTYLEDSWRQNGQWTLERPWAWSQQTSWWSQTFFIFAPIFGVSWSNLTISSFYHGGGR